MSKLFTPFKLKDLTLRNRIVVSPMCQYAAIDGVLNEWHHAHYTSLARGGAAMVPVEASAVSPEGRISPRDSGIWNDKQAEVLSVIAKSIKAAGAIPAIQLAHAGRKGSANIPWGGDDHIPAGDPNGWETIAPSPVALGGALSRVPREMTLIDIERVKADFVAGAVRAKNAGFECLMVLFAHGFLASNFLSSHANKRTDAYGGSRENRSRFLLETVDEIRKVWPENLPFIVRLGAIEYDGRDEETVGDAIALAKDFKDHGVDLLDISLGFSTLEANVPWGTPAFLKPVAERFRREVDMPLAASWGFDTPEIANDVIAKGTLDLVMVGKAHLANPHWPYYAARKLGVENAASKLPASYAHWLEKYGVPL